MTFDPFEKRHCRDIRNTLAQAVIAAVREENPARYQSVADKILADIPPAYVSAYIHTRRCRLHRIISEMAQLGEQKKDPVVIGALLWNQDLFFECHEWFEPWWKAAEGNAKKAIQALILACVVYEHLEYHRMGPAKKTAQKALGLLKAHAGRIPAEFDPDQLTVKLSKLIF